MPAICYLLPIRFRLASSKNSKMRETLLGTKEVCYNSKKESNALMKAVWLLFGSFDVFNSSIEDMYINFVAK